MPVSAIDAARRRAIMRPLVAVVVMSAGPALMLVLPLAGATQTFDPVSLGTTLAVLAVGVGTVASSLLVTRRTLRGVVAEGVARAE